MKINYFETVRQRLCPDYYCAPAFTGYPSILGEEFDTCPYSVMYLKNSPVRQKDPHGYYVSVHTSWASINFQVHPDHGEIEKECRIMPKILKNSSEDEIAEYRKKLTEIEHTIMSAVCG